MGGDDVAHLRRRVVVAAERVELERRLDLGALAHRRAGGNHLVGADRLVAALEVLEQIGDGDRGEIVVGPEEQRQAQIDQRRQFVALGRAGAAEAVERFRRAVAGVADHRRRRLAGGDIGELADDQRMVGDQLAEIGEDRLGRVDLAVADEEAGIDVGQAQRVLVGFVGRLEPALGFEAVAEQVGDQAGVIVAEHRQARFANAVERVERMPLIADAGVAPRGQQRGRHVMRLAGFAGGELGAGGDVLPVGDRARAERQARQAVVGIAGDQPLGERKAVGDVAVGERGGEGALDQVGVARIAAQGLARIDGGGVGVAIGAGDQRGEVISRLAAADLDRRNVGRGGGRVGCGDADERAAGGDQSAEQRRAGANRRETIWHGAVFPCEARPG